MRTMLYPLTVPLGDARGLDAALGVSSSLQAHLSVLLPEPPLTDLPVHAHHGATAAFAAFLKMLREDAEDREKEAREMFRNAATSHNVLTSSRPTETGATAELIVQQGAEDVLIRRFAAINDLVFFFRSSGDAGEPLPATGLLKCTLEDAGRPVLIVTDGLPESFARVVAIAWNGSAEGARAVTAAMPFLARAERVVILTVATPKIRSEESARLRGYLRRHGIRAQPHSGELEGSAGEALLDVAHREGAGLIVTGCYTRSRMRQVLFGGVTHHLLENCRVPMLMAH